MADDVKQRLSNFADPRRVYPLPGDDKALSISEPSRRDGSSETRRSTRSASRAASPSDLTNRRACLCRVEIVVGWDRASTTHPILFGQRVRVQILSHQRQRFRTTDDGLRIRFISKKNPPQRLLPNPSDGQLDAKICPPKRAGLSRDRTTDAVEETVGIRAIGRPARQTTTSSLRRARSSSSSNRSAASGVSAKIFIAIALTRPARAVPRRTPNRSTRTRNDPIVPVPPECDPRDRGDPSRSLLPARHADR